MSFAQVSELYHLLIAAPKGDVVARILLIIFLMLDYLPRTPRQSCLHGTMMRYVIRCTQEQQQCTACFFFAHRPPHPTHAVSVLAGGWKSSRGQFFYLRCSCSSSEVFFEPRNIGYLPFYKRKESFSSRVAQHGTSGLTKWPSQDR